MTTEKSPPIINQPVKSKKPAKKPPKPLKGWRRQLALVSRWLHIYLSMISFTILLFFAVTGLTLNHAEKWGDALHTRQEKGSVNLLWVNKKDTATIGKLEIVEYLRKVHHIKGAVSEFRIEDTRCSVSFKGPGYEATAFIDRQTGKYDLSETRTGFIGIINDLHKGRDTGSAWSVIIDISAVLMTLVSLSGLVLIFYVKRKRFAGLLLAIVATLFFYLMYTLFVP